MCRAVVDDSQIAFGCGVTVVNVFADLIRWARGGANPVVREHGVP